MKKFDRRDFIKGAATCSAAAAGLSLIEGIDPMGVVSEAFAGTVKPVIAVASKKTPEALTRAAVNAIGGMGRFVKRGDVVVVKPNIGWDRVPAQAANTNPDVVKTVVMMCLEAGAKKVRVFDRPCNDPRRCYYRSGIQGAVESIGNPAAVIEFTDDRKFEVLPIKNSKTLPSWSFYRPAFEADKIINVPIAKHHNAARLTMTLKNVMGLLGGNRGNIHHDLDINIAELNTIVKFNLHVLDAVRILTANGPQGGRLEDVKVVNKVMAGTDPVALDSYGATLFGITGYDVPHVVNAYKLGEGEIDLKKVRIINV